MDWSNPSGLRFRTMSMIPNASSETMADVNPFQRLRSVPTGTDEDPIGTALRDAGKGDEAAFGQFYDLTSALVYGIVLKVVRDPAISDEVTQEVFVELWRLAPRYNETKGSARGWAATIAHRRAVDRVRSEQAHRSRDQREHELEDRPADVVVETVLETMTESFERSRVRRALSELSETQREAVTLAYYGGHTYREVAALLNVPEGTVKTRIRDGLIRMRDNLGVAT